MVKLLRHRLNVNVLLRTTGVLQFPTQNTYDTRILLGDVAYGRFVLDSHVVVVVVYIVVIY